MAVEEGLITAKYIEPAVWVILAWALKEVYSFYSKRHDENDKKLKEQDSETKKNTDAILTLDKTMIELQGQIKLLLEQIRPLMRLPEDVKSAHKKLRDLHERLKESEVE